MTKLNHPVSIGVTCDQQDNLSVVAAFPELPQKTANFRNSSLMLAEWALIPHNEKFLPTGDQICVVFRTTRTGHHILSRLAMETNKINNKLIQNFMLFSMTQKEK